MTQRTRLIAANWKMNHLRADALGYARTLADDFEEAGVPAVDVVVFPPATALAAMADAVAPLSASTMVGGQDVHPQESGAHTGDLSAAMLVDAGARWALCGHSERRRDHGETSEWIAAKTRAARDAGLAVMLCIGETLAERDGGTMTDVLTAQLAPIDLESWTAEHLAIAYEPVWAIGTGRTASPAQAQEAHRFIRQELARRGFSRLADTCRLLYGGSVKPGNCEDLIALEDVDGFLIGGAGLDPRSFLDIIRRCDVV